MIPFRINRKSKKLNTLAMTIIANRVRRYFGISEKEFSKKTNKRKYTDRRHIFYAETRRLGIPIAQAGTFFLQGHQIVLHAEKNVKNIPNLKNKHEKIFINQ